MALAGARPGPRRIVSLFRRSPSEVILPPLLCLLTLQGHMLLHSFRATAPSGTEHRQTPSWPYSCSPPRTRPSTDTTRRRHRGRPLRTPYVASRRYAEDWRSLPHGPASSFAPMVLAGGDARQPGSPTRFVPV